MPRQILGLQLSAGRGVLALALPNRKCDTCVGDKYKVLMREDPEVEEPDARGGPRIAFEILPSAVVQMSEPPRWQRFAAGALLLFTAATALQIGLAANVSRLPKVPSPALPNGLVYVSIPHGCHNDVECISFNMHGLAMLCLPIWRCCLHLIESCMTLADVKRVLAVGGA